jgi:uncharacterized protein YqeY
MGFFDELLGAIDEGGEQLLNAFLADNPELGSRFAIDELKALIESDNEAIQRLEARKDQYEQKILSLVGLIKSWVEKSQKAGDHGRDDLVAGAQEKIEQYMVEGRSAWNLRAECVKQIAELTSALNEKQGKLKALEANGYQEPADSSELDDRFAELENLIAERERQQGL